LYEGLGLGLTICKGLVEAMGGTIKFASVHQGEAIYKFDSMRSGSIFEITVPLIFEVFERNDTKTPPSASLARLPLKQIKALVVDDNVVNQKVLSTILTKLGCSIDIASNGLECIERVRTSIPDIIFMDCQMPKMDGFEATRILRNDFHDVNLVIIAVTANSLSSDRERCLQVGMNDFVAKPVRLEIIKDVLDEWAQPLASKGLKSMSKRRANSFH